MFQENLGYCGNAGKKEICLNLDLDNQLAIHEQDAPKYTNAEEKRLEEILYKLEKTKIESYNCAQEAFSKQLQTLSTAKEGELKKVTDCLIQFLNDVKARLENMNYDDEMKALKGEWEEAINNWRCEVDVIMKKQSKGCKIMLTNFKNNLMNCHHFPKPLIDRKISIFIKDINNIIMSNERMYTETEIHLKMLFENMIQGWLVKYSLKEIIRENKIKECLELEEAILEVPPDVKNVDTITADETIVTLVDCLIEFCKQEMPTFQMISKLAMYLSHLGL